MPNDDSEDTTEMRERHYAVFARSLQDVTGGEPRSTKTQRETGRLPGILSPLGLKSYSPSGSFINPEYLLTNPAYPLGNPAYPPFNPGYPLFNPGFPY